MIDKEKAAPVKDAALEQIRTHYSGTSGKTQAERLLAALHLFPLTTPRWPPKFPRLWPPQTPPPELIGDRG
jgi:hypothetical protein